MPITSYNIGGHNFLRFGYDAANYDFVVAACSHYWNCCLPLSKEPLERVLLRDQLSELLNMIGPLLHREVSSSVSSRAALSADKKDLLLAMYGVLFQGFIDKVSGCAPTIAPTLDGFIAMSASVGGGVEGRGEGIPGDAQRPASQPGGVQAHLQEPAGTQCGERYDQISGKHKE